MNVWQKLNAKLPELGLLLLLGLFIYYQAFFLPFFLALIIAYILGDQLKLWFKKIANWELKVSLFLLLCLAVLLGFMAFTASFVARDIERFSDSFKILVDENQSQLDAGAQKVKGWVSELYDPAEIEKLIHEKLSPQDSLESNNSLDFKSLTNQLKNLPTLFKSTEASEPFLKMPQIGFGAQLASFLLYLVLILYNFDYFNQLRQRYHQPSIARNWQLFWQDFDRSFTRYFKLRSLIVLCLLPLFAIAFIALDLPGTYIYLIALLFLLYIPYFQYFLLIPIALSSLVLSTEINLAYWLIMAIVIAVFILASLLEEIILIPRIMEARIGLNPVIMVLGLSFWTYTLGTAGIIIGVPLTSLAIIYLKRFVLVKWFPQLK